MSSSTTPNSIKSSNSNSNSNTKRGGGRGGSGRGRGRGGGRRSGRGGRSSNKRYGDRNSSNTTDDNFVPSPANGESQESPTSILGMRDEEVLIAFMPYLKGDNQEAMIIHERYQSDNDQHKFLRAARDFLSREKYGNENTHVSSTQQQQQPCTNPPDRTQQQQQHPPMTPPRSELLQTGNIPINPFNSSTGMTSTIRPARSGDRPLDEMDALERDMMGLIADDDPVVEMPGLSLSAQGRPSPAMMIGGSTIGSSPTAVGAAGSIVGSSMFDPHRIHSPPVPQINHMFFSSERQSDHLQSFSQPFGGQFNQQRTPPRQPITPPRQGVSNHPIVGHGDASPSSPFSSLFPMNTTTTTINTNGDNYGQSTSMQQIAYSHPTTSTQPPGIQSAATAMTPEPKNGSQPSPPTMLSIMSTTTATTPNMSRPDPLTTPSMTRPDPPTMSDTPTTVATSVADEPSSLLKIVPPLRKEYQPKRLWTRLDEQPGKILANNVPTATGTVLDLHPREELKAKWMLPLSYLRQHAAGSRNSNTKSVRDLLDHLTVGLFRRGCTENGGQASIVSKEILPPPGESRSDFPFQVSNDMVVGTVPFFSPRTPGHVVFRLYWQDEPLYTLATGPTLNVRVTERDFESSIRFILSNFKAKKVNPTSLSSLNSLALVLEQFHLPPNIHQQRMAQQLEGAGRGVWGCICESRKVLDTCASEYHKTTSKLLKLEETVEELKVKIEEEEKSDCSAKSKSNSDGDDDHDEEVSENVLAFRDKLKTLMSGRASCERKWRDSQLAFASILRAVVTNPSMSVILRRDLISKLRLEYELWCPLSEEFAVPGDSDSKMWYEPLNDLPHSITADHFRMCTEARSKVQHRSLGFDPNTIKLESVLYPNATTASRGGNRQMNPAAVSVFNLLSAAMGKLYQDNYATADLILHQREMIRLQLESFVGICDCFPPGTKVAIFGSSANGFGSPISDLDMCLQIPPGHVVTNEEDPTGMLKMAKLAKILEENGMKEVDTTRLTARIPVIKFNWPKPLNGGSEGDEALMECDLSMHNPLAVLNTSLLRTYAEINPVPRVLAGVIKRWAKARDINNPAQHTLSSYGYIIMLLHFLTFHQRSGDGLITASSSNSNQKAPRALGLPLLPNLQWMDGVWPDLPPGSSPYKEYAEIPNKRIQHPIEERAAVNAYFYHPETTAILQNLQRLFPGQDLSLGILLASFFRYYAYEFDYKRYVVSLHSTLSHGLVEREVKAELDGWRNYSAALTIEDPFETFYDVAHVLRGGYYHRIRREFAAAYSKIVDVASGKTSSIWNNKPVDLTNMQGMELIEWICEPVAQDRDDASTTAHR